MATITVEKIGGTSMSQYQAVKDNIILHPETPYNRIFVVSAYAGVTDALLEQKKTGQPGVYGLFANDDVESDWQHALDQLSFKFTNINKQLFTSEYLRAKANRFIGERIAKTKQLLNHLQEVCSHGHFALESHLLTVRELLASLGEAHSAWNLAHLLQMEGINTVFIDLTGWEANETLPLDQLIEKQIGSLDVTKVLPIVTGYAHCQESLMNTFDRGYSEMTFSRIAVLRAASEAVIHKEYHLSSADPRLVGEFNVIPIGKTNYDIADQLANLGMEAIHPRAAKGLRQAKIPLRIKNTFEPHHHGTLITDDYVSEQPQVEIIAGMKNLIALEVFDQDMLGQQSQYEKELLSIVQRLNCQVVTKDFNANTITLYVNASLKKVQKLALQVEQALTTATVSTRKLSLVSAMGSDMAIQGLLSRSVSTLYEQGINIEAIHQNTRQVEMQFMINEDQFELAVQAIHANLIEVHDHGVAICEH